MSIENILSKIDEDSRTAVEAAAAATEAGPGGWVYRLDLPTTLGGYALGARGQQIRDRLAETLAQAPVDPCQFGGGVVEQPAAGATVQHRQVAGDGLAGGWQAARTLFFLNVLTGSVGGPGGTSTIFALPP